MASIVTTTFSLAGTVSAGYPFDEAVTPTVRHVLVATVANAEVLTINHSTDTEKRRKVLVLNNSTGAVVPSGAVVAVVYTDENTTTLTAGGAGAGTYRIIIEI